MNHFQYQNIYQHYKDAILAGEYEQGDFLPSESEMCSEFHVTRMTIRQALDLLVQDGLIIKQRGKGSKVIRSQKSLGLLNVKGFSGALGESHRVETQFIIKPRPEKWPGLFFFSIDESEKEPKCIYMQRIRLLDNEPVMLETTYLPSRSLDGFCDQPFINGSLFATLEQRYQARTIQTEQNMRAITADKETAQYLKIPFNSPVLQIYLKFSTTHKDITIYSQLLCNTQNYYISNMIMK